MSLLSVAKKVGKIAIKSTPLGKNTDLDKVHSKSILGRIMRKEHDPEQDGLFKSIVKGMMGGAYENADDDSLLGLIRNRNKDYDVGEDDTDDSNPRPVLASISDTARRVSAPTLIAITRQLQDVVNRVVAMGKHLKKQQDMMVDQAEQQEHINKENIMEANKGLRPNAANDNSNLVNAFNSLSARIANAAAQIESNRGGILSSIANMFGFGGSGGGLKGLFSKGAKATKLRKGITAVETASGMRYRNAATGRFVKAAEAIEKPGVIGRLTSKVGQVLSRTSKLAVGSKVAGAVGKITPQLIKKLALPLAAKAVGKTVLKSIPIVGAIAGVGFAAKRLLDGDIAGAGLDLVSGLGGPLTAIPALILSLARDLYAQTFGVQPESDPLVGSRMNIVKDGVKLAVEETIRPSIKPQQSTTGDNEKALKVPAPLKPAANDNKKVQVSTPPITPAQPQAKPPVSKPVATTPPQPPKAPAAQPKEKEHAVQPPKAPSAVAAKPANMASRPPAAITPTMGGSSKANAGKEIVSASMRNDTLTMPSPELNKTPNIPTVLPAKIPTTSPSSRGIGNVPDPTYFDIASFSNQMYFGAAA